MLDPQLLIQAGAVGIALAIAGGAYLLIRRGMELVNIFVINHMAHLTESIDNNTETVGAAIDRNTAVLTKLDNTVTDLNRRM